MHRSENREYGKWRIIVLRDDELEAIYKELQFARDHYLTKKYCKLNELSGIISQMMGELSLSSARGD